MNQSASIYQDMAARTGSSIYIGVVGPVRTGKSTFIKRFMETQVLPNIQDGYRRDRARDELPQSGSGRTIMTAEPKFVPEEAVEVRMEEGVTFSVRLIDCVGYMVPGAVGQYEDLSPRMVMTPWYDHEIPHDRGGGAGYPEGHLRPLHRGHRGHHRLAASRRSPGRTIWRPRSG